MKEIFASHSEACTFLHNNETRKDDVLVLEPLLPFGPIKNAPLCEERRKFLADIDSDAGCDKEAVVHFWDELVKNYHNIWNLTSEKEIRIWYSDYPGEQAFFYYLCSVFDGKNVKVNVIYESDFNNKKSNDDEILGWPSYAHDEMMKAQSVSKVLSKDEVHKAAEKWKKLQNENAFFRTVRNRELVSDFPDYRDGLTSLQRSVLYAMYRLSPESEKNLKATAVVAETIWCEMFGDWNIYSVLKNMSQKSPLPYPFVSIQGQPEPENDETLFYQNIKAELTDIASALLKNVDSEAVPYLATGRGEGITKPEFLPGDFPNVFCNGNYSLIPHKLENVRKMLDAYARNPDITIDELIDLIGEPFFTDGRIILNPETLPEIYRTGKEILRYKYADSEKIYEDEINYTLLKDGKGILMNLKELVEAYTEYRKSMREK